MKYSKYLILIPFVFILFSQSQISAQWKQMMGPVGDNVTSLASSGSTILCGTYHGFIYRSDDSGMNWSESLLGFNTGINARTLATNGSIAFCSHEYGVPYRSTNNGMTWSVLNTLVGNGGPVTFFSIFGDTVFSGFDIDGMFTSTNQGLTWAKTAQGLDMYATVRSVISIEEQLFLITRVQGVYTSFDKGANWTSIHNGLPSGDWISIAAADGNLYAGGYNIGVFKSTNRGQNWSQVNSGLTGLRVNSMISIGNVVFADVYGTGIFKLVDGDSNWVNVTGAIPMVGYEEMISSGDNLIVSSGLEMFISTNLGNDWNDLHSNGRSNDTIVYVLEKDDLILACNNQGAIHVSSDNGVTWNFRTSGIGENPKGFVSSGNSLFLGTTDRGILKSTDTGLTWIPANNGFSGREVNSMYEYDEVLYVAIRGNGIFRSFDKGNSWSRITINTVIAYQFGPMIVIDNVMIVVENEGAYKSTNWGQSWKKVASFPFIYNELVQSSFVGGGAMFFNGLNGLYYSTNSGDNWTRINNQVVQHSVYDVYYDGEVLSAVKDYQVVKTTNFGATFTYKVEGILYQSIKHSLDYNKGRLFAGSESSIHSTDYNYISDKPFVDFSTSGFVYPEPYDTIPIDCVAELKFIPRMSMTGNQINGTDQRATTVRYTIKQNDLLVFSSTKTVKLTNGQTVTVYFDTCKFMPQNESALELKAYCFSPSDTIQSNDTISTNTYLKNFNFGESVAANGTYYYANSTPGASCAPVQPEYWWIDTTGSTFLIKNGIPQVPLSSGNIDDGTFLLENIFAPGAEFMFYSTNYDDVEISTNGVIGLGTGVSGLNSLPLSLDNSNAPCPALFPFWFDLDFSDPDVTGKTLKYKKSGDMLVITFDRVPVKYAAFDAEHFMTFQIVLEPRYTENGIFLVMFDHFGSGSNFIQKYENSDLGAHVTGIKGCQPDAYAQYCYRNNSGKLVVKGPIIERPDIAVAFGSSTTVLPVELLSFTASQSSNSVELKWSTSREVNNRGFAIERKINDYDWTEIGFVSGAGNSSEIKNYSYVDNFKSTGKFRYRLKQTDYNGSIKYFVLNNEIVFDVPLEFRLAQNYPNPFNPITRIDYDIPEDTDVKLSVYDVSGREIVRLENGFKSAGSYSVVFNGADFSSGVYFYTLKAIGFSGIKRMIMIK